MSWLADKLIYEERLRSQTSKQVVRQPSARSWDRFRTHLDKIGIWNWHSDYYEPAMDGWGWNVEIRWGVKRVESRGSNARPPGYGLFRLALDELLDDPTFYRKVGHRLLRRAVETFALRNQPCPVAVPLLVKALKDRCKLVRGAATEALGVIGSDASAAVDVLIDTALTDDHAVRQTAQKALETMAPEARHGVYLVSRLVKLYVEDELHWAREFLDRLGGRLRPVGLDLTRELLEGLRSDESAFRAWHVFVFTAMRRSSRSKSAVRAWCIERLGWLGSEARAAVPGIAKQLNDPAHEIREAAVSALLKIELADPEVLRLARSMLTDGAPSVRCATLLALTKANAVISTDVPFLVRLLQDADANVRAAAAQALAKAGPAADPAIVLLVRAAMWDTASGVRDSAGQAFAHLAAEMLPQLVIDLLRERAYPGRSPDYYCLLRIIGPQHKAAIPTLLEALSDQETTVRSWAALALARMGQGARAAIPVLIDLVRTELDCPTRLYILEALSIFGPLALDAEAALLDVKRTTSDPKLLYWITVALGSIARDLVEAQRKQQLLERGM